MGVTTTRTRLAALASVLADNSRSEIVLALMDGRARTGGELARYLGVAPSTVSGHLARLSDAGLVRVEAQGRHRYVRLAGPDVAALIETICGSGPAAALPEPRAPAALRHLRTCYDHLAGRVAVEVFDSLTANGLVTVDGDGRGRVTPIGAELLTAIGAAPADDAGAGVGGRPGRAPVRACLDWTERRHHLAGATGAALASAFRANRWVVEGARPRSLRLTEAGRSALTEHFGVTP